MERKKNEAKSLFEIILAEFSKSNERCEPVDWKSSNTETE